MHGLAQETSSITVSVGSAVRERHARAPPAGFVETSTLWSPQAATHSFVDGHETATNDAFRTWNRAHARWASVGWVEREHAAVPIDRDAQLRSTRTQWR